MNKRWLNWLQRRQDARLVRERNNGYDYAAGALLRGEETNASLSAKIYDNPDTSLYGNAFDHGCGRALYRLKREGIIASED